MIVVGAALDPRARRGCSRSDARPRTTACAGSSGSTSQVLRASRSMRVPSGVTCTVWNRISDATRPVSASRVTVQRAGWIEGGGVTRDHGRRSERRCRATGPSSGTTGRTIRDGVAGPRWTSSVAGGGVGQTFGKSAPAIDTRIRWPAPNRQPVASRSMRQRHHDARLQRLRIGQRRPTRAVEHALGDEVRRAVGRDVGQADRHAEDLDARRHVEVGPRPSEDRQRRARAAALV